MTRLITVGSFTGPLEAHLAKGRLEAEGIPVFIAHENHIWANWVYSHALGGVKLQVAREFAEEAKKILHHHLRGDYEHTLREQFPDLEERKCPKCGSKEFKSRLPFVTVLLIVLTFGLLNIIFPLRRDNYLCSKCGTKWGR